jgi:hypothetical protein
MGCRGRRGGSWLRGKILRKSRYFGGVLVVLELHRASQLHLLDFRQAISMTCEVSIEEGTRIGDSHESCIPLPLYSLPPRNHLAERTPPIGNKGDLTYMMVGFILGAMTFCILSTLRFVYFHELCESRQWLIFQITHVRHTHLTSRLHSHCRESRHQAHIGDNPKRHVLDA